MIAPQTSKNAWQAATTNLLKFVADPNFKFCNTQLETKFLLKFISETPQPALLLVCITNTHCNVNPILHET